jgi:type VII secretion effector (TIGR04197 family)
MPKVRVIKSSVEMAQNAASKLTNKSVSITTGKKSSMSESTVQSMLDGSTACNQIVGEISSLRDAVFKQANKIPQIANAIEQRDRAASGGFGAR